MVNCVRVSRERSYAVDVLAVLFGIGSWVAVNGIFVQLPLIVPILPEGWHLPSYLGIIIEIANVGPLAYGLLRRWRWRGVNETSATFVMMVVGALACFLLIFLWDRTAVVFGRPRSAALLALVFCVSLVDCTSTVVFLPFMGFFEPKYLVSLYIGEGLSGLLPGLAGLAQGIGGDPVCRNVSYVNGSYPDNATEYKVVAVASPPNFGVEAFCALMTVMMITSFVAFVLLRFLPAFERERSFPAAPGRGTKQFEGSTDALTSGDVRSNEIARGDLVYGTDNRMTKEIEKFSDGGKKPVSHATFQYLIAIQVWIAFLSNGVLPAVSSYSCLPYGNAAYHLSVTLSRVANPLICLAAFLQAARSVTVVLVSSAAGTLVALYIFVLAVLSPSPPFVGTDTGSALMVLATMLFSGLISYTKASLGTMFRTRGVSALFWCGVATQIGSFTGSAIMFGIVNFSHVFHSYYENPCQ